MSECVCAQDEYERKKRLVLELEFAATKPQEFASLCRDAADFIRTVTIMKTDQCYACSRNNFPAVTFGPLVMLCEECIDAAGELLAGEKKGLVIK